jgi:hypothetical protein
MARWDNDPRLVQLARDLGLSAQGNCAARIREFAMTRVRTFLAEFPVGDLDGLRQILASRLSLKIEHLRHDGDVDRIATEHATFHPALRQRLRQEFLADATEGITLERDGHASGQFSFLAVVDARGRRQARAYFTTWHEIAHLLVHPPQLAFPGFRRTPAQVEIPKDPLEFLVDQIAGAVAFYEPFFEPALTTAIAAQGGLSFQAIEIARRSVAGSASLFAAAVGSIRCVSTPVLLVSAAPALKKSEAAALSSQQAAFEFGARTFEPKLRVTAVVRNAAADHSRLAIRPNMRVPTGSILSTIFEEVGDADGQASENQSWWETSAQGPLDALPITVHAARRGSFVYGLISLK